MRAVKELLKAVLPESQIRAYRNFRRKLAKRKYPLSNIQLECMLRDELGLQSGDVIMLHSSFRCIHPESNSFEILQLILGIIGQEGTLLAPTYPKVISREYMMNSDIFDVRNSVSYSGILTELVRRMPGAVRSLHPTKSVAAVGKRAWDMVKDHTKSELPFDEYSPYYKLLEFDGKVVGLGVTAEKLSFMHVVEDTLREQFPVAVYDDVIYEKQGIDWDGNQVTLRTRCHYMPRVGIKTITRIEKYMRPDFYVNRKFDGIPFFMVKVRPWYVIMVDLALRGITVYSKEVYREGVGADSS